MKSIILLAIYLLSFVSIYMMLSLVGLLFSDVSYVDILHSNGWSVIYTLFVAQFTYKRCLIYILTCNLLYKNSITLRFFGDFITVFLKGGFVSLKNYQSNGGKF